ncbi:hypothetical protein B398_04715 [Xylella fastidiosa 32]|nr:hypothetical protein B398_04715 [Xylella fastidiosa 32]
MAAGDTTAGSTPWGSDHIAAKSAIYPIKMQKCIIDRFDILPVLKGEDSYISSGKGQ